MTVATSMRLTLALIVAAAIAPSAASASTVSVRYLRTDPGQPGGKQIDPVPPTDVFAAVLHDDDGRDDQVEVDARGRIREAGAVPQAGCAADVDGWIACTAAPATPGNRVRTTVLLETGAGSDRVTLAAPGFADATADLGPGDDVVQAEGGRWTLYGGEGADTLVSTGQVTVERNYVDTNGPVWDGGPGPDRATGATVTVTYAGRGAPVRVTPDGVADDGEAGEGDDVGADVLSVVGGGGDDVLGAAAGGASGGPGDDLLLGRSVSSYPVVPHLYGDAGADVLRGGAASEWLDGGPGDDRLDGGAGADVLGDGPGADRLSGGPGDDALGGYAADGARDVFSGGPGADRFDGSLDAEPVRVSLDDRADDGTSAEHDDVRADWEHVSLRRGTLIGSPHDDELEVDDGGVIDGRGGDDVLGGLARMTGGPGRDQLSLYGVAARRSRSRADLRDGHGGDRVTCAFSPVGVRADRGDHVVGCAHPQARVSVAAAQRRRLPARGSVDVGVFCFGAGACRGHLWLEAGGRRIASATLRVPGERTFAVPVRRRGTRPCGTLRAIVRLTDDHGRARTRTTSLGRCAWR
jgi:RTX calcium-binding nonapeptide repeat (4 copies)